MSNGFQNSDIEIRTMKSDIEAIKAGGGDVVLMQNQEQTALSDETSESSSLKTIFFFIAIILTVAGIGFLAYYLSLKLLK